MHRTAILHEWTARTLNWFKNGWQHWVAPVLEGTKIQGFHIISLYDYFQEKVFPNQWRLLLIYYFFF